MRMNSGINRLGSSPAAGKTPSGFHRCLTLALCTAIALVTAGCQSLHNSSNVSYSTNALHEGDVVGITFQYSTNFNTVQKIALDGMLNLDMIGTVKASGMTLIELQQELAKMYQPLVKDDVVTVKLIASTAGVYVSGAVLRPGMVEMDRPLTVLEAVMGAGGFDTSRAKLSAVSVLRIENGQQRTYHVNLKKVLDGEEKSPFYLKPFDIIYVPAKTFNY